MTNLEGIETNFRLKLTVPLIATYLRRGTTQTEIARICGVSPQAVNDYIKRHSEELSPLIDKDDSYLTTLHKSIALKAGGNLLNILDLPADKKDMIALNIVSGTHTDKYKASVGKATNVTVIGMIIAQACKNE